MKAADDYEPITIVVKAGEKATITFQNEGKGFVAPDKTGASYPVIKTDQELKPTVKDASTAVYIVTAEKDVDLSLYVSTDYPADVNKWKDVAITVDGKVKEFTIHKDHDYSIADGTCPLLSHITSITFTNNGETLEALKLGTNSWKTNYMPKLGALTVPANKLTYIPAKTDENGKVKITSYEIGKVPFQQASAYVPSNSDSKSARSYMIKPSELFSDVRYTYLENAVEQNGFKLSSVKDENGNAVYAELDEAKAVYRFYNNSTDKVYWDGTFTADVEIIKGIYEGITLTGVQFEVAPAQFTLTIKGMNETKVKVEVTTNGNPFDLNTETMVKNQKFTLTPTAVAGSTFTSFEVVSGAIIKGYEGDSYNFETDGKEDVVIKVNAGVAANKIIFEQDPSGTLEVLSDGGRLTSGVAIETGAKLTIKAEAKTGFEIEKVLINDKEVEGKLTNENRNFEGEAKVPAVEKGENVVVKVVYKAKTYLFEVERPSAGTTSDDITTFKVFNKNNTSDEPFIVNGGNKPAYFAAGTELRVEITMKDATTKVAAQINGEQQIFRTDSKENVYEFDYTMPARNSKLVVTVDDLTKVNVQLVEDELAYNGLNQQVAYITTPQNMQGIIVTYANSDDKNAQWGATAYKEIGTHYVRFERKADAHYQAIDEIREYKITGAQLVITELPKVEVSADKTKWEITGGKIGYLQGDENISLSEEEMAKLGKFSVKTTFDKDATSASVEFTLNNANDETYIEPSAATVPVGDAETIKVEVNSKSETEYGSLRLMNGGAEIHNGDKLPDGTTISLSVPNKDPEVTYEVYRVDGNGETILQSPWSYTINMQTGGAEAGRELLSFRLKVTDNRIQPVLDEHNSKLEQKVVYNGKAQAFEVCADSLIWWQNKKSGTKIASTEKVYTADSWWTITYKQEDGTIVPEPINAGTYKVTLERKGGTTYQPIEPFEATLIVLPAEFDQNKVNKNIKATAIGKGSPLSDSDLSGTPDIAGTYSWAESDASVDEKGEYKVKFTPADTNYAPAILKDVTVTVEVTDKYILTYSNPDGLGIVEVRDAYGIVPSGSTLKEGTQLYLTAKPKDATKVRLVSIDGVSVSYRETGVTNAPFKFTGKMDIKAYFEVIEQEVIDPSTQYVVTVNTSGRGFEVDKVGDFGVLREGDFSFTVKALAADMSKIVVKTSRGETLTGKNGVYTIEEVTENMSVNVSLPNPTEIKVEIPAEYENEGGYKIGTVQVEGSIDGKYYYGDVITVIAIPVDGTNFEKWSDGSKEQVHEIALYKDTTLKATFKGVPTGIEDIESASISTGRGFILVKNAAHADVKVISISGRLQAQQEVNGDTRIDVPQGIYVVVLESGSDVKRVKVIVK